MAKPTYSKATQKVQRIFQRAKTRNTAQLPSGQAKAKLPKLTPEQLAILARGGSL